MDDFDAFPIHLGKSEIAPGLLASWRLFRTTKLYDLLAASPGIAWYALSVEARVPAIMRNIAQLNSTAINAPLIVSLLVQISTIIFLLVTLAFLILRGPAKARSKGLIPRISAFIGTYLVLTIVWLPEHQMGVTLSILSLTLILSGFGFAVFSLAHLGRSFSLMADARKLVTNGPYAYIRHPLYLGEAAATLGIALHFLSPLAIAIVLVQLAFQLERMKNEERILASQFPDYEAYRARTARLVPGLY